MSKTVADLIAEYRDRIGQLKLLAADDFRAKNYCGGYQCEGRQKELLLVINDLCRLQSPSQETVALQNPSVNTGDGRGWDRERAPAQSVAGGTRPSELSEACPKCNYTKPCACQV